MRVVNHNWSATKQRLHPQTVAEISRRSVLSGDRIRQCGTPSDKIGCVQCAGLIVLLNLHLLLCVVYSLGQEGGSRREEDTEWRGRESAQCVREPGLSGFVLQHSRAAQLLSDFLHTLCSL